MNPEQQIAILANEVRSLREELDSFRKNPLPDIIPNEIRIRMGIGFIGKDDSDTTATGCLIVNSPEGPIKILYST